jgi:hypothetical protein
MYGLERDGLEREAMEGELRKGRCEGIFLWFSLT